MSSRRVVSLMLLGTFVPLAGCGPFRKGGDTRTTDGVIFDKGAIILTGSALENTPGTVLAAMSGKVPNFQVRHRSGQCPEITLRSNVSLQGGDVNPQVYVDGTRATDTCILETLRTDDVERVEVYPQGFTTRPGYATHSHGLILVFMRSAGSR